ncbi:MAG: cell division protein FtsZ [Clostridium sp.]|jgi:cell division protein FtsZ|nr:cell division protein FtsZ [Clostridium sp.]
MGIDLERDEIKRVQIKVVGVGGGGCNAVARMAKEGAIQGCELIAVNTDAQHLRQCGAATRTVLIGQKLTEGKGAGFDPEKGRLAAEESREELTEMLRGTDMVFVTAGMGGGTGTGAAPVIAEIAKGAGALTVGVVTTPFGFEGRKKMSVAMEGVKNLNEHVDSLIVIPNQKLLSMCRQGFTIGKAFAKADEILCQGVRSITRLIYEPGFVNLDFADIRKIMENAGLAHMAVGTGSGKDRAKTAIQSAINCPLLETSIDGATGLLVNFEGKEEIDLSEMEEAMEIINEKMDPDVSTILGSRTVEDASEELSVTVIATGFSKKPKSNEPVARTHIDSRPSTEPDPPSPPSPPVPDIGNGGQWIWNDKRSSSEPPKAEAPTSTTGTYTPPVHGYTPPAVERPKDEDSSSDDFYLVVKDVTMPPPGE